MSSRSDRHRRRRHHLALALTAAVVLAGCADAARPTPSLSTPSPSDRSSGTAPPVALPLVWLHPKWHPVVKVLLSVVILGTCWLMYVAFQGLMRQLDEATKMLNEMQL